MKALTLTLALIAITAAAVSGQVFYTADAAALGVAFDTYAPSAAYPIGAQSPIGPIPLPAGGALGVATPWGGMCIDQLSSTIYTTDGLTMSVDANQLYGPFVPLPPSGAFPIALATGAPITGLAFDSLQGLIIATDGFNLVAYPPAPPFFPVGPVVPVPTGAPLTGLGFEPSTNTLWGVDLGGIVINFGPYPTPFGPIGFFQVPIAAQPGGLAVNTSNGPGAFPAPFCSAQLPPPAFHVAVTDGFQVYDVFGIAPPIPLLAPSGAGAYGLSFSSDFQITPGGIGCMTTGLFPLPGIDAPAVLGSGISNNLAIANATPMTFVTMMFDICPLPGGALLSSGETLWMNPLSAGFATVNVFTDAAGLGLLPVPFGIIPPGGQFTVQWAIPDVMHPLGFCLSDAMTITTGLP